MGYTALATTALVRTRIEPIRDLRPARRRARAAAVAGLALAGCLLFAAPLPAQCIDYGLHTHWAGGIDTPGGAAKVALSGALACLADGGPGLQLIDIADPTSPHLLGTYNSSGSCNDVDVSGTIAYIADGTPGLGWSTSPTRPRRR